MKCKDTDDLKHELMAASDLDRFLEDNEDNFCPGDMPSLLGAMFEKREMTKATLAYRAGMSNVYLHQVFSGRRNPSRNRILCICIAMEADLEETQALLKSGCTGMLYPKNRRDAIIIYGLLHGQTLFEVNDKLFCQGEEPLC